MKKPSTERIAHSCCRTLAVLAAAICAAFAPTQSYADLPSGYRQLDYVDTDGNQWVNTLFRPTCTNAVEMKASVSDFSSINCLYCTRRAATNRSYTFFVNAETGLPNFYYKTKNAVCSTPLVAGTPYVFAASPFEVDGQDSVAEISKAWTLTCAIDGSIVATVADAYFTVDDSAYFCLFGSYVTSASKAILNDSTTVENLAKCRFYYFKAWDTKERENLLCHIIPVYGETEQAIGLYDLVAGRFLPVHGKPFSAAYTFTADEVWTNEVSVAGNVMTVDLAGKDLTIATEATVATNSVSAFAGSAYQDLSYLLAVGKQAVHIDGFRLPGIAKVEMKIRPTALCGTHWLFSSRAGAKNSTFSALIYYYGSMRFDFNAIQTDGATVLAAGDDYTLVFNGSTSTPTWYVDGVQENAHKATSNNFTGGGDLFLFGESLSGTFYGRLYYFTVTTNDTVILDLRPVRRIADGAVGLYDTVGDAFYASGSGTEFPSLSTPKFTNSNETTSELNIDVQGSLPGYTAVEKIVSSANAFIKTEYVPDATDRLELRASLSDVSDTKGLFCSRKTQTSEMFTALYTTSGVRFDFNAGASEQKTTSFKPGKDEVFTVALDGNEKACYTNGAVATTFASNDFTPTATVYLFAIHTAGGTSTSRTAGSIYWFKAWSADGTLKVDMVPAVRDSDSVAGLYDRVRRKFYPSAQTEQFTAGSTVGDGKLYVDEDGAFDATEIGANIALVKNGESAFDGRGTTLAGTLKPVEGTVCGVVLQSGATLDLSALSDSFSLDDNDISFADNARITIDLGSRTVSSKTALVTWTTAPANVATLTFVNADGSNRKCVVKSDGIYPAPKGMVIIFR